MSEGKSVLDPVGARLLSENDRIDIWDLRHETFDVGRERSSTVVELKRAC